MNISNDKKSFYQWETNRFLVDEDFKINQEVCFSSVKLRKALVVKTKLKNNKIVVEVPNLLLQDYHPIMVHWVIADENGKYVTKEQEFQVLKRAKPEDYVYTETEIFSFLDLEQRLKNLEEEGINKAIADYFVKNPIQSGATSEQVAQIIQNKENIEKLNKNKLDADKLPEAINNALTQAEASGAFRGEPGKDGVVPVTGAAVGQTVKITAVDENGNPTEWEATDFPESSTQADWNQNDESAVDYIKNKPFYTETVQKSETREFVNGLLQDAEFVRLVLENKQTAVFTHTNGNIFTYLKDMSSENHWLVKTDVEGVPPLQVRVDGDTIKARSFTSITVNYEVEKVHKLDVKYLPDSIARVEDVEAVSTLVGDTSVSEQITTALTASSVLYSEAQTLTKEQKAQARANISKYDWRDITIANTNYTIADYSQSLASNFAEAYEFDIDDALACTGVVSANYSSIATIAHMIATLINGALNGSSSTVTRLKNIIKEYENLKTQNVIGNMLTVCHKGSNDNIGLGYTIAVTTVTGYTHEITIVESVEGYKGRILYNNETNDYTTEYFMYNYNDASLTKQGYIADAKAVGDALVTKVSFTEAQELTEEQKQQAQNNIGFSETDAIELAAKMGLVSPTAAEDGSIYTDENGALYSL